MKLTPLALGAAAALAMALPMQAQEYRFGLQAHASLPQGDLKDLVDNKAGLGGGVHMTIDFGQGHQVRPRIDFTAFPDATVFGVDNKVSDLSYGADYLYHFQGATGFYATGGLAANRWKVEWGGVTTTSTRFGYALGAGYTFNEHVSADLRYTASQLGQAYSSSKDAGALQVAAYYRF